MGFRQIKTKYHYCMEWNLEIKSSINFGNKLIQFITPLCNTSRTQKASFFKVTLPDNVTTALIGSKGGWILSTISMFKVFLYWSIIKLRESIHIYFLKQHISLLLLIKFTGVA